MIGWGVFLNQAGCVSLYALSGRYFILHSSTERGQEKDNSGVIWRDMFFRDLVICFGDGWVGGT